MASKSELQGRQELFQDAGTQRRRRRRNNHQESNNTVSEAVTIQQSLQRTQDRLQSELERVSNIATAIDDDGKALEDTMTDQKSLNTKKAARALRELERAQQLEQTYLTLAIVFFWCCFAYVMWCRVLVRIPFVDRIVDYFLASPGYRDEL